MFARMKAVPLAGLCLSLLVGVLVSAQSSAPARPAPVEQGAVERATPPPGTAGRQSAAPAPAALSRRLVPASTGPRRIEVLFLGHASTHHDSGRFAPMLQAALAPSGVNFTYTIDLNDLNAANLAKYDALMIYANHTKIAPAQEKALLDFVAGGKGFLPIHSASFCFQNSEPYIALVGAQFQKHGTGEFTTEFTNTTHPVMRGLKPFQVWDETYVHTKHNPDRTVLMERVDAAGREPWTWVRNHGKGRVFYTAYGHDERVWNNPNFHQLIQNALLWSVGPTVEAQLEALNLQPLRYTKGIVPVPNYERRDPAPLLQDALTTDEAAKHFQIPVGFELQLFASEPMINGNPEVMAWDERGRLWVLETKDYPNNPQPSGQGNDTLKILEDTNRDGRADKATIFADKLSIPSGMVFANGGVIVAQAAEFVFLKDTNGDDKADVRQTIMTGWGVRDTHAVASNLKYGMDNWLYGAVGYSGFDGVIEGRPLRFQQALYRFSADGKRMQHMANFTNNTWGLAFNETNDLFGSTANNDHSFYVPITLPHYQGVRGLNGLGRKKIDGHYAMHANTQKIRQVDVMGGFTAVAGHNFYTARAFPQEYWNRVAFVNEPTAHIIHRAVIDRKGSGFAEVDGWNLVASADEWMAPVHSEVGPDGAVWFADFYDFIIQHNPTPAGPVAQGYQYLNGRGNAYDTPLRESQRGRIYRLAYKGAKPSTPLSLSASRPAELVSALRNDNMFWRLTAQRLLVERGRTDVLPQLYAVVADRTVDAIGLNAGAAHALWTIHGLGALDGTNAAALGVAKQALTHPSAAVRKAAQSVLPKTAASTADLIAGGALKDRDLNARLNAFLVLSTLPTSPDAGRALYLASKEKENVEDEWLPEAIWIAAAKHEEAFYAAYSADIGAGAFAKFAVRGARGERDTTVDWSAPGLDDTGWTNIQAPRIWGETPLGAHLGVVWLRRTIDLPTEAAGKAAFIRLGTVDDTDATFINGSRVGGTNNNQNAPRQYAVPPGVLVPGRNVISVRVSNSAGRGGMIPDIIPVPGQPAPGGGRGGPATPPPGPTLTGMTLHVEGTNYPLAGQWRHKVEETWEGGRRREIPTSVPIAQQYLLANSPVRDLITPPAVVPPAARAAAAAAAAAPPTAGGAGAAAPGGGRAGGPGGRGGALPLLEVAMGVIVGENKFSQTLITARPGQPVAITFNNNDDMPHNIVVFRRGDMAAYEKELIAMLTDPTAQGRGYVPDSPNLIVATPLLNPRQAVTLTLTAPTEPGDYPFVCTFPGHWVTMRGILRVQ